MAYFYKVLVGNAQYHGKEALTYRSTAALPVGAIVEVPLQKQLSLGVVTAQTAKPGFATKDITKAYSLPLLPSALLKLAEWLQQYYPAPLGMITQQILPGRISEAYVAQAAEAAEAAASVATAGIKLPVLTADQAAALGRITGPDTYLLHGDTGTGKTRVYIEAARKALTAGRSAIILTPEIGLTSQLAGSFRQVFGAGDVIVVHSQLTAKDRQLIWLRILLSHRPLIVVGPRSALFVPLRSIGLVVVDEAHETAYKQEQAPHYQAVRVASQLAGLHQAMLILGSATPSITDYFIAEQKHKPILRLRQLARATSTAQVQTEVVDLKDRSLFTRSQHLSDSLIQSVEQSLRAGQQSLLYLNRRGTARIILCGSCGWQATCPRCDLPLAYHHDSHRLLCHSCGWQAAAPSSCPDCGNADIVYKAIGTKAIVDEVQRLFPDVRVMRFDTDNTKAERFESHYEAVRLGQVDILIGTQLLAKGLDLPGLSTLGVIIADTSLSFPDFTATERTYQLLTQVVGRVGRGHLDAGRIIVQTYAPDKPVIAAALARDWPAFYQSELPDRKQFFFPPFCYLLKLSCKRATSVNAAKAAELFMYSINRQKLTIKAEGPMPSFHGRVGGKYEWQIIVKSTNRAELLKVIALLPKSGWTYDIDPTNLL